MKRLLIAAALAVTTSAHAGPYTYQSEAYCQHLAEMATALAEDRELGATLESARSVFAEYRAEFDDEIMVDYLNVAEAAYTYPRLSPSDEGNVIYNHCMGY